MGTSFLGIGISTLCPSHTAPTEAFTARTLCTHFQQTERGPAVHSIDTLPATTFSAAMADEAGVGTRELRRLSENSTIDRIGRG